MRVRIPQGLGYLSLVKCCLLSGGLCVGLITRPEESYRSGVSECDREPSIGGPGTLGALAPSGKIEVLPVVSFVTLR
jgi:hypothetical protein